MVFINRSPSGSAVWAGGELRVYGFAGCFSCDRFFLMKPYECMPHTTGGQFLLNGLEQILQEG
jgi:hypothetical protein